MALNKENAAPDVTAGTATGQHLCNDKSSIANEAPGRQRKLCRPGGSPEIKLCRPEFRFDRIRSGGGK